MKLCSRFLVVQALASLPVLATAAGNDHPVEESRRNTLVFDHCQLDFKREQDANSNHGLPVLRLKHGEWFQVRFTGTDPRLFDYTITAVFDEQVKSGGAKVGKSLTTDRLGETRLAMRHDENFKQYKLTIQPSAAARDAAPADEASALRQAQHLSRQQLALAERLASRSDKLAGTVEALRSQQQRLESLRVPDTGSIAGSGLHPSARPLLEAQAQVSRETSRALAELKRILDEMAAAVSSSSGQAADSAELLQLAREQQRLIQATAEQAAAAETGDRCAEGRESYELYGIEQVFGVDTSAWEVTFSGGTAFSGLTSPSFFLKTDDNGTPAVATDDTRTVEVDPGARDGFKPDVLALANLRLPGPHWFRGRVGFGFGFGLGDDANPRYYAGPTYKLGDSFILALGWAGGKVAGLPAGQSLGKPPIAGDTTLSNLPSRFRHAFYAGIAFSFVNREKEFSGRLSVSSKATESKAEEVRPVTKPSISVEPSLTPAGETYSLKLRGSLKGVVPTDQHALKVTVTRGGAGVHKVIKALGAGGDFEVEFSGISAGTSRVEFELTEAGKPVELASSGQTLLVPPLPAK